MDDKILDRIYTTIVESISQKNKNRILLSGFDIEDRNLYVIASQMPFSLRFVYRTPILYIKYFVTLCTTK